MSSAQLGSSRGGAPISGSVSRAPHPALRGLVRDYVGYRHELAAPLVHHGAPTTTLTAILAIGKPLRVGWLSEPDVSRAHRALVSGLGVQPAAVYQEGVEEGIQLELTPLGARALLGVSAAALSRSIVDIADVAGPDGGVLQERVAAAPDWRSRFEAVDAALLAMCASARCPGAHSAGLQFAWTLLHRSGGRMRVDSLAQQVGWSRRRLDELFAAEFGVSPKQTARLVRFNRASGLLRTHRLPLAEVASVCGFADQPHLTREFSALAGTPPRQWLDELGSFGHRARPSHSPSH